MKRFIGMFLTLLVAGMLTGCGGGGNAAAGADSTATAQAAQAPLNIREVVALARVEPEAEIVTLGVEVSGIVRKLYKQEGAIVRTGDVILDLDNAVEAAQVNDAAAGVSLAASQIAITEAQIAAARTLGNNQRTQLERLRTLLAQQAESQQNVDNLQTQYQQTQDEVRRLEAQVQNQRLNVASAQQKLVLAQAQLGRRQLRAPANGTLISLAVQEGTPVQALSAVGEFAPSSALAVLAEIDETYADRVRVGQQATVRHVGRSQTIARGTVTYTAPTLKRKSLFSDVNTANEDRRVREVRIRLTEGDSLIFGARVEAVIAVESR